MNSCNLKNHIANCFSIELGHLWLFLFCSESDNLSPSLPFEIVCKSVATYEAYNSESV